MDIINSPDHFSNNYSLSPSGKVFYSFRKCGVVNCESNVLTAGLFFPLTM